MNHLIQIALSLTPRKTKEYLKKNKMVRKAVLSLSNKTHKPEWLSIGHGPLKGRSIYLAKASPLSSMSTGLHDIEQIEFIEKFNLKGKVIFDIGAHIGYMTLCFSKLVGTTGKVFAFEPNPYNIERFKKNLEKNEDLAQNITIFDSAVTDKDGIAQLTFSTDIDGGTSSGGFLNSADTALNRKFYSMFEKAEVKTVDLHGFKNPKPDLIKIDIEGFEGELVKSVIDYLRETKPLLVIEIHSILNMFTVLSELQTIGYSSTIIKKEEDGRCTLFSQNDSHGI